MWYVQHIYIYNSDGCYVERPCMLFNVQMSFLESVRVVLCESETGELQELTSGVDYNSFCKAIESFHPYGFVPRRPFTGKRAVSSALAVQIDDLSLKFLSFIKSISMTDKSDKKVERFVARLKSWVTQWDDEGTLVEWSGTSGKYACPLFQMVCYQSEGWLDDKFYLRTAPSRVIGEGMCVEFYDVTKVRIFVAKALTMGFNPMAERAKSRYPFSPNI